MVLVNNAKSVCSHAFGCGKGSFKPLGKEDLHQLMLTTALLVVCHYKSHGPSYNSFGH